MTDSSVHSPAGRTSRSRPRLITPIRSQTAIDKVRKLSSEEWREQRDGMLDEISHPLAGLDTARTGRINDQILALLSKVRLLGDDELKAQRADLEKAARQIVGEVGPFEVLRHLAERSFAEQLFSTIFPQSRSARPHTSPRAITSRCICNFSPSQYPVGTRLTSIDLK